MASGFGDNPMSNAVALFIIQVLIIVALARFLGYLLRVIKQPMVIGEIIAGILLGPTAFSAAKAFKNNVFPASSLPVLNVFANIGLIFFMFLIGLEFDPALVKKNFKQPLLIASASIILPFTLGIAVSYYLYLETASADVNFTAFFLFMGAAMSITAFPVLARILSERKMLTNKIGALVLSCAAMNDVVGWILLAISVSIARATQPLSALWTLLLAAAFIFVWIVAVRPLIIRSIAWFKIEDHIPQPFVVAIFFLLFVSSWICETIGIHAMFGAFTLGAIMPKTNGLDHKLSEKIEDLIVCFLLPLYFVYSGLKTEFGLLNTGKAWEMAFVVIATACFGKIVGAGVLAKLTGLNNRESLAVGILMNTRGLVELIVLNLGYDLGVIGPTVFSIMVLMALFTTFLTSPLLYIVYPPSLVFETGKKQKDPSKYRIVLCVSDVDLGTSMVSVASTLTTSRKLTTKIYALRFLEISDRPSSYMKQLLDPKDSLTVAMQERAKVLRTAIKTSTYASAKTRDDISSASLEHESDLLILGWNSQDIDAPGGTVIADVLRTVDCTVGVLVARDLPPKIRKVMLPFFGQDHDPESFRLACRMAKHKGVELTIIVSPPAPGEPIPTFSDEQRHMVEKGTKAGSVRVLELDGDKTLGDHALDEAEKNEYSLIVLSTGADWHADRTTPFGSVPKQFITRCSCSLLFIHDTKTRIRPRGMTIGAGSPPPASSSLVRRMTVTGGGSRPNLFTPLTSEAAPSTPVATRSESPLLSMPPSSPSTENLADSLMKPDHEVVEVKLE